LRTILTRITGEEQGFALWEMAVLLVVVGLFLAGVIVLASQGTASLQPENTDRRLSENGRVLMDRLEALTREAVVFYGLRVPGASSPLALPGDKMLFAADLDGDAPGGAAEAIQTGRARGTAAERIEDVTVARRGGYDLTARVVSATMDRWVVLTRMLDARQKQPFTVEYTYDSSGVRKKDEPAPVSPGPRVTAVRISVKLADRGKTLQLDRAFTLKKPAPARPLLERDR
jgi:hypothetical protein